MKKGILLAIAALGLALFAVPDSPAEAWGGHYSKSRVMHLSLSGSNFVTSSGDGTSLGAGRPTPVDGRVLTALANGIALGKHGRALFTTQSVLEEITDQPGCRKNEAFVGGAGVTTTTVLTFEDGSLLTLAGPIDPDNPKVSFYCTDGVNFSVKFRGTVAGGTGRFEGATGTWRGTAEATGGTGRVTAKLRVKLDNSRPSHHGHHGHGHGHGDRD